MKAAQAPLAAARANHEGDLKLILSLGGGGGGVKEGRRGSAAASIDRSGARGGSGRGKIRELGMETKIFYLIM